jgi:glycogen debranching enzyme
MLESLENTGFCLKRESSIPVPSYDRYGYGFSPVRYWRGPVWINIDWLLMRGLERYEFREQAQRLRRAIVGLVQKTGFYEYFDPLSGRGHGSDFFSWTAALLLDVLLDEANRPEVRSNILSYGG